MNNLSMIIILNTYILIVSLKIILIVITKLYAQKLCLKKYVKVTTVVCLITILYLDLTCINRFTYINIFYITLNLIKSKYVFKLLEVVTLFNYL